MGAAPLTGLTGLSYRQVTYEADPQATPEERYGGPADPRHGTGAIVHQYPSLSMQTPGGSHGPYGPENQLLGDPEWVWEMGGDPSQDPYIDRTPSTRAGPFPKGILSGAIPGENPTDVGYQREQSMAVHAVRTNAGMASLTSPQGYASNDEWHMLDQTNPGHSDLIPLPKQALSSGFMFGTRDRVQSMARQNEFGFDSAHQWRRWARSPIPGNFMWMRPGGRPLTKTLAGPARPAIGSESPFAGQDVGAAFGINGAVLQNVPTEYAPPPQPNLAPSYLSQVPAPNGDDSVVEWY